MFMRLVCFLMIAVLLSSYSTASLHAAEFGFADHDHHEVECQIDDCFMQPISDAVNVPEIMLSGAFYPVALAQPRHRFICDSARYYISRAPPLFV